MSKKHLNSLNSKLPPKKNKKMFKNPLQKKSGNLLTTAKLEPTCTYILASDKKQISISPTVSSYSKYQKRKCFSTPFLKESLENV